MLLSTKNICFAIVLLATFKTKAQENNNWVFGLKGGGLNFSNDTPVLFQSNSNTISGTASISDEKGNLLLYFDGYTVFNKNHIAIKNGEYLKGAPTGIVSSILLKSTVNSNLYYLFFGGENHKQLDKQYIGGIYAYSIDISANSGEGIIDTNCVHLFPGCSVGAIGATWHSDNKQIWLLCRLGNSKGYSGGQDSIVSILFNGQSFAVKQILHSPLRDKQHGIGTRNGFAFSNNGEYLAETFSDIEYYSPLAGGDSAITFVSLFNFDNTSGKLTNKKYLHYYADVRKNPDGSFQSGLKEHNYKFGCEFSLNDSFLYVIDNPDQNGNSENYLVQFPIHSNESFKNSLRYKFEHGQPSSLKVGPNGKLYIGYADWDVSSRYRILTLDCPDKLLGNENTVNLSAINLPDQVYIYTNWFPIQLYKNKKPRFKYERLTCNDTGVLKNLSDSSFKVFTWYFDNDTLITTNQKEDVPFPFNKSGKYFVKLKAITNAGWVAWYSDSIVYLAPPASKFIYQTSTGCQYVSFSFIGNSHTDTIKDKGYSNWNFGDGKDTSIIFQTIAGLSDSIKHIYTKSGVYTVRLILNNGFCSDTIEKVNSVIIKEAPRPGLNSDKYSGCNPLTINLNRKYKDTVVQVNYDFGNGEPLVSPPLVNQIDAPLQHTFTISGNYTIKQYLIGSTGCITVDSLQINTLDGFKPSQSMDLQYATVDNDTSVSLRWSIPNGAKKLFLYKSTNKPQWSKISEFNPPISFFTDKKVNPLKERYWYKIIAFDTCGQSIESNLASTILLTGTQKENEYSIITWQQYENWVGGVIEYDIETLSGTGQWIKMVSVGQTGYTDYAFTDAEKMKKCYRITAKENGINGSLSTSNIVCLPYIPAIWMPTGFTPNNDKLNDTLKLTTLGITDLSILIFNSYGEEIFYCRDSDCVWDGNFKGWPVPEGIYTAIISAKTNTGQRLNHKQQITIVR